MADPGDYADVNPEFSRRINRLLADAAARGIPAHAISGYRNEALQAKLYANYQAKQAGQPLPYPEEGAGGIAAKPGESYHNYGFAEDILANDPKQQQALISLAADPTYGITALGAKDPPHFQMVGSLADLRKQYGTSLNAASAPVPGALANQGPETVGQGPTQTASEGPQDPRQIVYNKLIAAGLQPHQALGALWGLGGESGAGLDPRSYNANDPGGSIGYGQWNRERRTALEELAKTNGTSWADPNTQADHIVNELTNPNYASYQPGVLDKLKAASTAEDAAKVWTGGYERPAKDNSDQRIKGGPNVATLDNKGNLVLGPGGGGTTAPGTQTAGATLDDRSWWQKIIQPPVDAQGDPVKDAKSPLAAAMGAMEGKGTAKEQMEEQAPEQSALGQGPGARNVSPGLANIAQVYGQTLNSFSQPLTWGSRPLQGAGMAPAGLQSAPGAQAPGISLNSVLPSSMGLGYGIPAVGYGYG